MVPLSQDQFEWCKRVREAIDKHLSFLPPEAQKIVLTHAAYESGFGMAKATKQGNNIFNITAGAGWTGHKWKDEGGDTVSGPGSRKIDQWWRIYPDLGTALQDYWMVLSYKKVIPGHTACYYDARLKLIAGDLPGFVRGLADAGYFGLAPSAYLAGMKATMGRLP